MVKDVFGIVGSIQDGVFRVDEVVAQGGFAVVYRARHEGFKAEVALKCLKIPGTLSEVAQQRFLSKFREEGELLFRLSALIPPVVRPLHVGVLATDHADFVPFLALEWLSGESLDALIERRRAGGKRPLGLSRVVELLGPVARALERAHAFPTPDGVVSILHRDLKPENLFIADVHGQRAVKILDFGIGTVKHHATQMVGKVSTTRDVLSAFTPAYGSPEQWLPKRFGQTGPWTDVWGLALCAVEALTGRPALEGDAHALLGACIDPKQRPTPRTLGAAVPDEVETAFAKALAVNPRDRYADIGAFWDDVERPVGWTTPRLGVKAQVPLESVQPPAPRRGSIPAVVDPRARQALTEVEGDLPSALELDHQGDELPTAAHPRAGRRSHRASGRVAAVMLSRLRAPLSLIVLGLVIMAADFAHFTIRGSVFQLGPFRALWLAGPLVVLGLLRLLIGLFSSR